MDDEGKTGAAGTMTLTPEAQANADAEAAAKVPLPTPSTVRATRGRMVLLFHQNFRYGPYPAQVTADFGGSDRYNVNPAIDGANEQEALKQLGKSNWRGTVSSAMLYDPLKPEERKALLDSGVEYWAEWPVVPPAGVGQGSFGAVTRALSELLERVKALEDLAVVQPTSTGSAQLPAKLPEAKIAAVPADEQPAAAPRQPRSTNPVTGYTGPAVGKPDPARHDANR